MTDDGEIWTIGHWTCPVPTFLEPLDQARIDLLVDVRAQPGSRRNPQFGSAEMARWLSDAGIGYLHLPALGDDAAGKASTPPSTRAGRTRASRITRITPSPTNTSAAWRN